MSANPFTVGDVVQLKSGSPAMTVQSVRDDLVYCVWLHDGHGTREEFHAWVLEPVKPVTGYLEDAAQYVKERMQAWHEREPQGGERCGH